jgi:nucleotide-binding universal stress UspA family protein
MYTTVIWATDGSDGADAALVEARRLVDPRGRIVAAHCDQRLTGRAAAYPVFADEDDRRIKIREQVRELVQEGFNAELVVRRTHGQPAEVIANLARETNADVIVCGTRGLRAFAGAFLGSFTQHLLPAAPCPVLAVPVHEVPAATSKQQIEVPA